MDLFTSADFKIFALPGFNERMGAIMLKIRPKLASIGEALAPKISELVDQPLFVHVLNMRAALSIRRTIPGQLSVQIGADIRKMSILKSRFPANAFGFCLKQVLNTMQNRIGLPDGCELLIAMVRG